MKALEFGIPKVLREKNRIAAQRFYNPPPVPEPRDGMTLEKFLKTIGRGAEEHVEKIQTWENLFNWRGKQFRRAEIPIKVRKWIMRWTEHYRQGREPKYVPIHSQSQKYRALKGLAPKMRSSTYTLAEVKGYNGYLLYLKRKLAENRSMLKGRNKLTAEEKRRNREVRQFLAEDRRKKMAAFKDID
eukprot:TRINITY_DN6074_c0_g2_i2.p1 TRINITY_DN6074_c0_g2~~TRINITY_DN6074_c0_g2_i2.p1  ORF type:complete len:209 (+),score=8.66 TRINITY_DN6074_c0_g2_i2:70-627(+)